MVGGDGFEVHEVVRMIKNSFLGAKQNRRLRFNANLAPSSSGRSGYMPGTRAAKPKTTGEHDINYQHKSRSPESNDG